MKRKLLQLLGAFALGTILPGLLLNRGSTTILSASEPILTTSPTITQPQIQERKIPVLLLDSTIVWMELETYITGVVLAEMPAEFEQEALRAQAVVARTYALKRQEEGIKHPMGAVCTDPGCCQAYRDEQSYLNAGGLDAEVQKVKEAVRATAEQVLLYQDQLIEATYFSCSGGKTEKASAVWGTDVPYLQSVDSPGEENATHYTDRIEMSSKVFASKLGLELSGQPASWFGNVTYTSGGGVATIMIGGREFYGVDLREKLNLYSTAFSIMAVGENVHIFTRGFGHRVGMSQYGADAMATNGCDYQEILSHYYPGTTLSNYLD